VVSSDNVVGVADLITRTRTVTGHGTGVAALTNHLNHALAEQPRVVVCDLRAMTLSASDAVTAFAPAMGYLSDWPGSGILVVCARGAAARDGLQSMPVPPGLVVAASRMDGLEALEGVLPPVARASVQLVPRLTAPASARAFTARVLSDWQLTPLAGAASLVVSELVTNAVLYAESDMELALTRSDGRVRISVRDHGPGTPVVRLHRPYLDLVEGRGLLLVEAITRGWGVFTAQPNGKTVWAVLDTAW